MVKHTFSQDSSSISRNVYRSVCLYTLTQRHYYVYNFTAVHYSCTYTILMHMLYGQFGFWDWGLRKACLFFKRVPQVLTTDPISQLLTPITMERYNSLTEYASNLLYYHQQFHEHSRQYVAKSAIVQQNVAIVQQIYPTTYHHQNEL